MRHKKSDRGRLVKKFREHTDWKSFKSALGSKQKGTGIYVLYKGDHIFYIGLSKKSMRSRLRKHALRDRLKGKWDNFSFYQILKKKYIKDIETLLLRVFSRKNGNIRSGKFKSRYNLAKIEKK